MSKFEYLTVFSSIVMAIAVSEILSGLGRLIRHRDRVRIYWVHILWMFIAVSAGTQEWWNLWRFRDLTLTTYPQFAALFLPSMTFVVIAFILTPSFPDRGDIDLRRHFSRNRAWLFPLMAVAVLEDSLIRSTLGVENPFTAVNGLRLAAASIFVALGAVANPRVHGAAVVAVSLLLLAGIVQSGIQQ